MIFKFLWATENRDTHQLSVDNDGKVLVGNLEQSLCNQEKLKKALVKYRGYVLGNEVASNKSLNELTNVLLDLYKK